MANEQIAVRTRVSGRVQGVAFRAWTRDTATALGLGGWVANEPDGTVLARICGPRDKVAALLDALRQGPPVARVTDVDVEGDDLGGNDDFRIAPWCCPPDTRYPMDAEYRILARYS